jgi:hypothetical protein
MKNIQVKNFVKIRPVGAQSFHVDRRREGRIYVIAAFHTFAKAPTNNRPGPNKLRE